MESWLEVPIRAQPDDTTCGPTCLHAVYGYYGLSLSLDRLIEEVPRLEEGGTLAVLLGIDALRRGFDATLLTYNLMVFDPTWFADGAPDLPAKLRQQLRFKGERRLRGSIEAHLTFLEEGGAVRFEDLTPALLRRYLKQRVPILTGLSATYLYRSARERFQAGRLVYDDVRGVPQGHFVVLSGYDALSRQVRVADPLRPNPLGPDQQYDVDIHSLLDAILLGIVTYDANLLIVRPRVSGRRGAHADPPGRRPPR